MSDEGKAGVVSLIWLAALTLLELRPCAFTLLLLISVTVVLAMYVRHDYRAEQADKRLTRYKSHLADEANKQHSSSLDDMHYERMIGTRN